MRLNETRREALINALVLSMFGYGILVSVLLIAGIVTANSILICASVASAILMIGALKLGIHLS